MDKRPGILVVDDQVNTLRVLALFLKDNGFLVHKALGGKRALALYREMPHLDVILSDLKMPGMDGLTLFKKMEAIKKTPPFIIMTAYATVQTAINALKAGVTDYLIKPLNFEELPLTLAKVLKQKEMSRELDLLRRQVGQNTSFQGMIGQSETMLKVFELIKTVAPTDAPVLITGETGSGKELIAKSLHKKSHRKDGPMVSINCAALTESLLEAQLFGHKKGSFTGALKDTMGLLEKADQGTLFLDEIDKMSLALQAKLLRFLEEKTFRPVGGSQTKNVDVRIIAASNQDLAQHIRQGGFLCDLLYRIEVIKIKAPCLKERKEDIPLLCKHFLEHYARHYRKPVNGINTPCLEALANYHWPGNVRELKNCLARAVILSRSKTIKPDDLPAKITGSAQKKPHTGPGFNLAMPGSSLKEMETSLIQNTMEHCKGNKSLAARMLGISRKGLYQKLKRLGLESEERNKR